MGEVISLFGNPPSADPHAIDGTALLFANIEDLRAHIRPTLAAQVECGGDLVLLRVLNVCAGVLLDPECTDEAAKLEGWASLEVRRGKGYDMLRLVNELWSEFVTIKLAESSQD